eukprot:1161105-Pelagomonas_calceolata.AAC.6
MHTCLHANRRWEVQQLSNDATYAHLEAVFDAHHDRILAHEKGVTRMSVVGFLGVLRESALLDNATAPTDADRIFRRVAEEQQQESRLAGDDHKEQQQVGCQVHNGLDAQALKEGLAANWLLDPHNQVYRLTGSSRH